jgi:hypothetical protein
MSHLIDIFLQPGKVFVQLKDRPTFVVPTVIAAVFAIAMTLAYFLRVDPAWFAEQTLVSAGSELSAKEIEQMKAVMPSAPVMGYIGAATAPVTIAAIYALLALYFLLAGKVAGVSLSFKQGLSLVAWSGMPAVLGSVVGLIGALTMSPQTTFESLMLTNIDPLFVQLASDDPWAPLLRTVGLLNLWVWFLSALGWKTWGRTGWGQAIFVSVLPYAVIFAGMAAFAMMRG